jgi:hypothetical protein
MATGHDRAESTITLAGIRSENRILLVPIRYHGHFQLKMTEL